MKYDVAVIGGGPAGMITAIRASELGASVVLVEKNTSLGVKLLCTGKGRCNITNNTENVKELVAQYGKNGRFLFSALHKFGVSDVIDFFEKNETKTKVERGNRVFPNSDLALDVLKSLTTCLKKNGVTIITGKKVNKILKDKKQILKIVLSDQTEIIAKNYVLCTGGKSYPETGCTGDGYSWAIKLGHSVVKPIPVLSPLVVKEKVVGELEGLSLKNVKISIYREKKKIDQRIGEALFTKRGMSGPIILDMSKKIQENISSDLILKIDFKPALDISTLDKRIQKDWSEENKKMFKNSLNKLLPSKLIPVIIKLSKIDPDKKVNSITKQERMTLIYLLKEFKLNIQSVIGFNKAIVTSGGVKINEINPKTMQSKIIDNLYFAGEIIDIDGPTGGYNLQICWSTGYLAGESSANSF